MMQTICHNKETVSVSVDTVRCAMNIKKRKVICCNTRITDDPDKECQLLQSFTSKVEKVTS